MKGCKHNFETYCFGIFQIRIVFFKKKPTSSKKSFLLESRHYNYTNYCQFLPPLGNEKQKYLHVYSELWFCVYKLKDEMDLSLSQNEK